MLQFSYSARSVFVMRSCGVKSPFLQPVFFPVCTLQAVRKDPASAVAQLLFQA